ncbi:hypothetical protein JIX56_41810 [Streptomyces sp. CA-210063]|nr:sigma factor [Streptomyces sp. CA-210063]UUU35853.1 hypothetical protein JIX56_41810 [Streptomyces sp. CA-210063]
MTPTREGSDCETFVRELYEHHGKDLLRFASRLLGGDWHQAEDIVQEAATRAWHHVETLPVGQCEGLMAERALEPAPLARRSCPQDR